MMYSHGIIRTHSRGEGAEGRTAGQRRSDCRDRQPCGVQLSQSGERAKLGRDRAGELVVAQQPTAGKNGCGSGERARAAQRSAHSRAAAHEGSTISGARAAVQQKRATATRVRVWAGVAHRPQAMREHAQSIAVGSRTRLVIGVREDVCSCRAGCEEREEDPPPELHRLAGGVTILNVTLPTRRSSRWSGP